MKHMEQTRLIKFQRLLSLVRIHNDGSAKKVNEIKKESIISAFKNLNSDSKLIILDESERLKSQIPWLGADGALELIATIGLYRSLNEKR